MSNEIWKSIKGYLGIYEISNCGNVRSLDRFVHNKGNGALCAQKGRILKPTKDKGGYLYVGLHEKHKTKTNSIKVHRLVALSFVEGYSIGLQVNHKNGIRHDNRAENLEWVTRSENIRDTFKRGRKIHGENNNASKLQNRDIGVIASLYDSGIKQDIIAKAFGVSQGTISNIVKNKHYKNLAIDINTIQK